MSPSRIKRGLPMFETRDVHAHMAPLVPFPWNFHYEINSSLLSTTISSPLDGLQNSCPMTILRPQQCQSSTPISRKASPSSSN